MENLIVLLNHLKKQPQNALESYFNLSNRLCEIVDICESAVYAVSKCFCVLFLYMFLILCFCICSCKCVFQLRLKVIEDTFILLVTTQKVILIKDHHISKFIELHLYASAIKKKMERDRWQYRRIEYGLWLESLCF